MPFVSEELFRRLPRRTNNEPPSICVMPYPEVEQYPWHNIELENDVEFVQNVVKSIRSIRSDYNLTPKMKADVYLKCLDEEMANVLRTHPDLIKVLSSADDVHILLKEMPPEGCAVQTVSAKCETHLMLKGLIDIGKEIQKLEGKKEKLGCQVTKLREAAATADYNTKVPEHVRQQNAEKLNELTIEVEKLARAIETLAKI